MAHGTGQSGRRPQQQFNPALLHAQRATVTHEPVFRPLLQRFMPLDGGNAWSPPATDTAWPATRRQHLCMPHPNPAGISPHCRKLFV